MEERFAEIEAAFAEVESALGDPEVLADPSQLAELGKRHADLKDVVADIRRWRDARTDLAEAREMAEDPDMARLGEPARTGSPRRWRRMSAASSAAEP